MDLQPNGKRAPVTGSSSGIGAGIARLPAAVGCCVNGANLRVDGGGLPTIN